MERDLARRDVRQLPSGRHGIPRALIMADQRARLLDGVMQVAARDGVQNMRISDVIAAAGVSRRTFYDHFANKELAFLAAYDMVIDALLERVDAAFGRGRTWPERVTLGLEAFLRHLAEGPDAAHVCIVDVLAAGPAAAAHRDHAMRRYHPYIVPGPTDIRRDVPISALTVETVIGGLYEVVYTRVAAGRTAELPALLPHLLHASLLPFVGADTASAHFRMAQRRLRTGAQAASPHRDGLRR
ncbi:MAG: TetR/AcrR family transcriptional regulator [Solirubrobacteraceae bacterium]